MGRVRRVLMKRRLGVDLSRINLLISSTAFSEMIRKVYAEFPYYMICMADALYLASDRIQIKRKCALARTVITLERQKA